MKRRAVIVAPGRGTYNREELGYLARHHAAQGALLGLFDNARRARGQTPITALDGAGAFSPRTHTTGDNAAALIHACAYCDFLAIDRERYEIIGITGNSMGWYIALACAGVLDARAGFEVVNTMGTLMQEHLIGGQLIYPFVDDSWQPIPGARARIFGAMADIAARPGHALALSIDLGGMVVLAGNEAGLAAFEAALPPVQGRFPMRLPNHAAFHTALQAPVAEAGRARLGAELFGRPALPLIDGRGALWFPQSSRPDLIRAYTLGHQVVAPYDFTAAIRTAARELMPDLFIVLGPGTTLGGAVAQSLLLAEWRGLTSKQAFQEAMQSAPPMLAMGRPDQRAEVVAGGT